MKENNESQMPWLFFIRRRSRLDS